MSTALQTIERRIRRLQRDLEEAEENARQADEWRETAKNIRKEIAEHKSAAAALAPPAEDDDV